MTKKDKTKESKHTKCVIRFDNNPAGVYKPGDAVSGTIELVLEKNKKFRGVCLRINGFAESYWDAKVKNDSDKKKRKTFFKGREDYFSSISYFVGSDVGNPLEIAAGSYNYPFSCVIPEDAPASMEGNYGHIRYMVKVTLERPWKHDIVYQAAITVKGQQDLNLRADTLSIPTKAEAMTSFYFGFTEPLIVTASTPRSGYAPGEVIELVIHVNNQSSVDLKSMVIKLQRIDTFISQVPCVEQHLEHTVLEERKTGKVARRKDARFEENILIGIGIPSDESRCQIIQTKYEIEIVIHPIRSRKRPTLRIPIVLGSVGLSTNSHANLIVEKQKEALLGYAPSAPAETTPEQMPSAPPSYLELQEIIASTSRAFSVSSNLTLEEPAEHESEKGSEPYSPREF